MKDEYVNIALYVIMVSSILGILSNICSRDADKDFKIYVEVVLLSLSILLYLKL